MKTRFSPNKMILTSTHCTPSRIKTRNFLTKLTVLTKSNMNSSTTISPNTITTANTPRSLTDRCEGNIFSVLEPICTERQPSEKNQKPPKAGSLQSGGLCSRVVEQFERARDLDPTLTEVFCLYCLPCSISNYTKR